MSPYLPTDWQDEVPATTPVKYKITQTTDGDVATDATIEPVTSITPGTPLTAANLNKIEAALVAAQAQLDTNQPLIDGGAPNLFTARGDLVVGTGNKAAAKLASVPTSVGKVLTTDDNPTTGLAWTTLYGITFGAEAYIATPLTLSTGANTTMTLDAELFDPMGWFDIATYRYTVPANGPAYAFYMANVVILTNSVAWAAGDTLELYARKSGTWTYLLDRQTMEAAQTGVRCLSGSTMVSLSPGQYIDIYLFTNKAGVQLPSSTGSFNYANFWRVG